MIVLQAMLAFMIVLGPLVLIHEFGHFIVAKMLGIGVPVFSLGFGPRLFGFHFRDTDYRVSAIPLGGYVRLTGDEADENRTGGPEEFLSRPKWQRFLVFVAGATFNVLLALFTMWMLFAIWGKQEVSNPDAYPVVMGIAEGSVAAGSGLERGDRILELGGQDVRGATVFREVYNREIVLSPNTVKSVLLERGPQRVTLELEIGADPKFGHGADPGWYLSWGADETPVILDLNADTPAQEAGLEPGDVVLGVGEQEPISELALRQLLEASADIRLDLKILRDEQELIVPVTPRDTDGKGRIGAVIGPPPVHRDLSLSEAFRESVDENLSNSLLLFEVLKRLVSREVPLKTVSGPIGIAQYARQALISGPRALLWMVGFFSLQLGILNLLPIPVLDGGHIMILGVEGVLRRDLSERIKERVMQFGFMFLMLFMSVVIVLDVVKL